MLDISIVLPRRILPVLGWAARWIQCGLFALVLMQLPLLGQTERVELTLKGSWGEPSTVPYGSVEGIMVVSNLAYVTQRVWQTTATVGLVIYDLAKPFRPAPMAACQTMMMMGVSDVCVVGDFAYLAADDDLLILEVRQVLSPIAVSRAGDTLVLTWSGGPGIKLQRTRSLANPSWTDVPDTEGRSRTEWPIDPGQEFFRLVKP